VTARRRRGVLLLSVALASGGLAASQVHQRERRAAEALGPAVEVLVAARDLPAGARLTPDAIAVRRVPASFAPSDAIPARAGGTGATGVPPARGGSGAGPTDVLPAPRGGGAGARGVLGAAASGVLDARVSVPVAAGTYLSAGLFQGGEDSARGEAARRGQRAVTVGVAGGGALAGLSSGARVDVLVSSEAGAGGGRTVMALAGAELVGIGEARTTGYPDPNAGDGAADGPTALATLRVSVRQAIYLTAADNFAREIRLLPRPPGDPSRAGATITQSEL
jgi:pilus assembly protein CpaB